jgi:hypothetical protein
MRNFLKDERGAIAITTAFMMVPLIGAVALAVEVANFALVHTRLQGAADAAAISAVLSGDEDYADVARAMASANGFDDGVTVTREACPSFVNSSGDSCVHVTISHDVPLIFAPVVGYRGTDGSGVQRITAEAVAAPGGNSLCVLAMHDLTGRGSGDLRGCSTMANDTAACDSSMAISTSYANGSNSGCGARRVAQPLLADPYLGAITIPSHTCGSGGGGGGGGAQPSGRVSGTVSLSAGGNGNYLCGDQVLTGNVVFTSPLGQSAVLYIKDGGLNLNNFSASSAFGSSVTLVFTGTSALTGHAPVGPGSLELSAPATGVWAGIALAIDPNTAQGVDFSISGNWRATGIIYAPRSTVTWSGTIDRATKNCVVIVARDLVVDGGRLGAANTECEQAGVVQPRTSGSNARLIQ